jgi:hypothetical protein
MESNHPTGGLPRPAGFEARGFEARFARFRVTSLQLGRVTSGQICRGRDTVRDTVSCVAIAGSPAGHRHELSAVERHRAPRRPRAGSAGGGTWSRGLWCGWAGVRVPSVTLRSVACDQRVPAGADGDSLPLEGPDQASAILRGRCGGRMWS